MPDVNRINTQRPTLKKAVGKAASGRPNVEANLAPHVDRERLESMAKLSAAATDERVACFDDKLDTAVHKLAWLCQELPVCLDRTRHEQRLRSLAGLGLAALDEQYVGPNPSSGSFLGALRPPS